MGIRLSLCLKKSKDLYLLELSKYIRLEIFEERQATILKQYIQDETKEVSRPDYRSHINFLAFGKIDHKS